MKFNSISSPTRSFLLTFLHVSDRPPWLSLSAVLHGLRPGAEDTGHRHPEWGSQIVSFFLAAIRALQLPVARHTSFGSARPSEAAAAGK